MPKELTTTPEDFERLLNWLDQDRTLAAERYELIRGRLIRFFVYRGCTDAENLADKTIDRVTSKLIELIPVFEGNPANYFHGVAEKIFLEWRRRESKFVEAPGDIEFTAPEPDPSEEMDCLESCLEKLGKEDHRLVLEYYQGERSQKIQNRRELAEAAGMSPNALQVKILRIRKVLSRCLTKCVQLRGGNVRN